MLAPTIPSLFVFVLKEVGHMGSFILGLLRPKVLILDDEWVIADTLGVILSRNGFEAETAYSGQEAVDKAQRCSPDLLTFLSPA